MMMIKCWYYSSCLILGCFTAGQSTFSETSLFAHGTARFSDFLNAQHHSIYIPNYLQAFDYPNADETPSPSQQQQDQADYRFNDGYDPFQWDWAQTSSVSPEQVLFETSAVNNETSTDLPSTSTMAPTAPSTTTTTTTVTITTTVVDSTSTTTMTTEAMSTATNVTVLVTEQTTSEENSTQTATVADTTIIQNETIWSTDVPQSSTINETETTSSWTPSPTTELLSTSGEVNQTAELFLNSSSTMEMLSKNESDFIMNFLNQTHFQSKNLMDEKQLNAYNATPEETARHLTDRKTMQSLIHLLPPNLWSQLQTNFSAHHFNQSHYAKPALPDPNLLNAAAAQAGLPGPGLYPVPGHLWQQNSNYYRNPPPMINSIPIGRVQTTCTYPVGVTVVGNEEGSPCSSFQLRPH